ncbi:MAG: DUF4923 family protein [Bacteroidales bacterium]|jgi:hypothetical protein|nr:DUF4923 family protein [Bacteroidales bacterium]
MKKIFVAGLALSFMFAQSADAQGILSSLLSGATGNASSSSSTNTTAGTTAQDVLGNVINNVVSSTTGSSTAGSATGSIITNLIASVTGDITTTASSVVGTWSYSEPSVQFESENYLTQAGGAVIADKVKTKLTSIYKLVGIKEGKLKFAFDKDGNVTYSVGSLSRQGTYVFNSSDKTITITTSTGASIKSYVTVTGSTMYLTFDGTKLLTLMKTLGSKFNSLSTITSIANSYEGMKVGFQFTKQ